MNEENPTKATLEKGDLVASYILNTSLSEPKLLETGIVLSSKEQEVLVYSIRLGEVRWWSKKRWRILNKK